MICKHLEEEKNTLPWKLKFLSETAGKKPMKKYEKIRKKDKMNTRFGALFHGISPQKKIYIFIR